MKPGDVLAVVVSYNGLDQTKATVDALRPQVGHVHIIDNGSGAASLSVLEALAREPHVSVERLGANRGVGFALNRGVQGARQMGFTWMLTMDQDSLVDGALMRAYQDAVEQDPRRACLTPTISYGHAGAPAPATGVVRYAITSGNLVRLDVFDQIGPYDEGFFIDCIDFDFSLRVRRAGHTIYRVAGAVMRHELGAPVRLPAVLQRYYARHSPVRRYYMYRNYLYMVERYFLRFPAFIAKLGIAHVILTVLVGFFDADPAASYRAIGRGIADYAARRNGPYPEPSSRRPSHAA